MPEESRYLELPLPSRDILPVRIDFDAIGREAAKSRLVPLVVTSTKPDFYKQWPLLPTFKKAGLPTLVMNTGQHFDSLLGYGLDEFGIRESIAIDLQIRGNLSEKTAEVVTKLALVAKTLSERFPESNFLPIVHGDTHAAGIVPLGWMFASNRRAAQNEAGLRAMQPSFSRRKDFGKFVSDQFDGRKWSLNRTEPFPEQYDTFIGGAAAHFHFAPVELNKESLLREGYPERNIPVVGNSVVEAFWQAAKSKPAKSVFEDYPMLEKGEWIRVDVHRRENMQPGRFAAILGAVKRLVSSGKNVIFLEMNANKFAMESFGFSAEMEKLKSEKNFLYTGLWREYSQVVEFLRSGHCLAELTDSGSMQEELNELAGPLCLTCRFSTDRPETVFGAHSNLIVPPVSPDYLADLVSFILGNDKLAGKLRKGKKLYGKKPSEKIAAFLKKRREDIPFEWANERAGVTFSEGKSYFL